MAEKHRRGDLVLQYQSVGDAKLYIAKCIYPRNIRGPKSETHFIIPETNINKASHALNVTCSDLNIVEVENLRKFYVKSREDTDERENIGTGDSLQIVYPHPRRINLYLVTCERYEGPAGDRTQDLYLMPAINACGPMKNIEDNKKGYLGINIEELRSSRICVRSEDDKPFYLPISHFLKGI